MSGDDIVKQHGGMAQKRIVCAFFGKTACRRINRAAK